ncbi:hypothetical protein V8E55_000246 [Tylopilus felleus]
MQHEIRAPEQETALPAQRPAANGYTVSEPTCEFSILFMQEMHAQLDPGQQNIRNVAADQILPLSTSQWNTLPILNNYLQKVYRDDPQCHLTYDTSREGPDNRPNWEAIAYLHEIEWGRGNGATRGSAMEAAAKGVLIALGIQLQN